MLIGATAFALLFAVKRRIALHRQWATRSYAIALVFIGARFVRGITGWEALRLEIAQAVIWSCLALSVVLADVAIHWKEIRAAFDGTCQVGCIEQTGYGKNRRRSNLSGIGTFS